MFLDQFACVSQRNEYISYNLGNTFACKFSKNKNNLHVIACSTERGELVVQNTLMDDTAVKFERSEYKNKISKKKFLVFTVQFLFNMLVSKISTQFSLVNFVLVIIIFILNK